MRRILRGTGIFLVLAGIGVLAGLLYWQVEADAQTVEAQAELMAEVQATTPSTIAPDDDPTFDAPAGWSAQEMQAPRPTTAHTLPPPEEGSPIGVLTIPSIDFEWVAVEGVGVEDLKQGPGHMPWTPMPGTEGNATISGHRTTYGGPFHDLHLLEAGDEILFANLSGQVTTYLVTEILIVSPTDVWVTEPRGEGKLLTFTTCNPIGSARERLIVFAKEADNG